MKKTRTKAPVLPHRALIAALSVEIDAGQTLCKILPAGEFTARDGRPTECSTWILDGELAQALIAAATARNVPYLVDYEHQSLRTATNGKPVPAAGWFKSLEWRPDDGLYAEIDWTAAAAAMIDAREYLYLSPVFQYDAQGHVTALISVALTNSPALDSLPELQLAALSWIASLSTTTTQESSMDLNNLLESLRWMLNLPVTSTAEDVSVQLQKLIDMLSGGQGTAAASVDIIKLLSDKDTQLAALSTNQVDLSKFVPIETMTALQTKVAELSAQLNGGELDQAITAALADGRLLPAQEGWARDLGKTNMAALTTFLASAPKIAALTTTQTRGAVPAGSQTNPLSTDPDFLTVCNAFGNDPATVLAQVK